MEITLNHLFEKYGYVVPTKGTFNSKLPTLNYKPVARFTKKPTVLVVEELLKKKENSEMVEYWLSAFVYMINVVRSICNLTSSRAQGRIYRISENRLR